MAVTTWRDEFAEWRPPPHQIHWIDIKEYERMAVVRLRASASA